MEDDSDDISARTWKVVFFEPRYKYVYEGPRPWFAPFMKKGFHHIICISKVGDVFCSIEWTHHGVNACLDVQNSEMMAMVRYANRMNAVILEVPEQLSNKGRAIRHPFLSCVQLTQHVLGVHKALACTPYKLYKHLLTLPGTKVISEGKQHGRIRRKTEGAKRPVASGD